jgi:hypothetical protein
MEFERPSIFNNNNQEENIDNFNIEKFHNNLQNRSYEELYKPSTINLYRDNPSIDNSNNVSKKYIGVKNIKLIDNISKYLITTFYAASFKTDRIKIFYMLDEVLTYLQTNDNIKSCYLIYKNEIILNTYKRINTRFMDYIFKMIDINLDLK